MAVGAGDVARAAGAGAVLADGGDHGVPHGRVLAHAEIVVGAPHSHFFLSSCHMGAGEFLGQTIDVVEVAV